MECRYHPACPGCPLLPQPYDDQLRAKERRLAQALALYPHLGLPRPEPIVPALRTEGYRHRLKLPVHLGESGVSIGLYSRDGRAVLDTPECPVLAPGLREVLASFRAALATHPEVHSLDLRVSDATGEVQAVLACAGGELLGGKRAAAALLRDIPKLSSLAISVADPDRKRVMGRRPRVVAGKESIEEGVGAARYRLHPGAFFQADPRQAERLHALVRTAVGEARHLLDLYAGVGAYAIALAPGRQGVVAVEEVESAAQSARAASPANVRVVCGDVAHWLAGEAGDGASEGRRPHARDMRARTPTPEPCGRREPAFDCAILNPGRAGADRAALERLPIVAERAVYVSCGPETLARDLDLLAAQGLRATRIQPIDLFPQTPEVETVVTLRRAPGLHDWPCGPGRARSPWVAVPNGATGRSGAAGRPERALALVIGDPGPTGDLGGARFRRIGRVATHALIRLDLGGPLVPALATLGRKGHPVAGEDHRTARFFAEKAGLHRPFVHIEVAGGTVAPLHGDLVQTLLNLGADAHLLARAGVDVRVLEGRSADPATEERSGSAGPSTRSRSGRRGGSRRRS